MTDYIVYKTDRWLYPLEPANENTTIMQVRAGTAGTWLNVALTSRTYYAAANLPAGSGLASNQALWPELETAIETALGSGTVTIEAQDSTDDRDIGFERIKINWSEGQFQAQTAGNGLINGRDLGFAETNTALTSSTAGELVLPFAYAGAWHSFNFVQGGATIKRKYPIADNGYSSERHWEAQRVSWGQQNVRIIQYQHIPAARVMPGRSNDPQRAKLASLGVGDPLCFDRVFEALQDPQRVVLIAYDLEQEDGLSVPLDRWESVQLWRPWLDYSAQVTDMNLAGDYWQLELALRVAVGDYAL